MSVPDSEYFTNNHHESCSSLLCFSFLQLHVSGLKHYYLSQDSVCFLQSVTLWLKHFSIHWNIAFAMIPFLLLKDEMLPTISKKKYRLIVPPRTYEMSVQRSCYQIQNTIKAMPQEITTFWLVKKKRFFVYYWQHVAFWFLRLKRLTSQLLHTSFRPHVHHSFLLNSENRIILHTVLFHMQLQASTHNAIPCKNNMNFMEHPKFTTDKKQDISDCRSPYIWRSLK